MFILLKRRTKIIRTCRDVYYRFRGDGGRGATMLFSYRGSADAVAVARSASQSLFSDGYVAHLPMYTDHSTWSHRRHRSVRNRGSFFRPLVLPDIRGLVYVVLRKETIFLFSKFFNSPHGAHDFLDDQFTELNDFTVRIFISF